MRSSAFRVFLYSAVCILAIFPVLGQVAQQPVADPQQEPAAGGQWVYSVKFVCGFNSVNGEILPGGLAVGEAEVKLGNYATEINVFNPSLLDSSIANIRKKLVVLSYKGDARGREPNQIPGDFVDGISLNACSATMDDCNRIYQLFIGGPPPTPPPPMIGYFVLYSDRELDVTAVYTAEICSDWAVPPVTGGSFMCTNNGIPWGAGLSIDVERIPGRFVID